MKWQLGLPAPSPLGRIISNMVGSWVAALIHHTSNRGRSRRARRSCVRTVRRARRRTVLSFLASHFLPVVRARVVEQRRGVVQVGRMQGCQTVAVGAVPTPVKTTHNQAPTQKKRTVVRRAQSA